MRGAHDGHRRHVDVRAPHRGARPPPPPLGRRRLRRHLRRAREWEDSSAHFLKCGASAACGDVFPGADIELECVGDVDHSGHDHGRRLSGDNECAVVASKDNDGDGIVDLAAEGECCVSVYGSKFDNEYGCGTTLAEVQAGGCCPEDFIARYSLQPDGESQNGWDCVSFVDKDGCTEKNTQLGIPGFYQWSADVMGPGYCPHTVAALDTLRNIQGCGTCAAEDLHDGRCGVFWLETGRWKDWAVLGMEEIGCQKDTCCASSSSACCKLNVSLVAGLACGALVFILCCVALCCFACAGCPAYKARHKHAADSKADAPPPLVPIPKADVRVEVPYGYEGAGTFAAEEEEVVPAEAVLAAEPSPPAQSWAPELEQELEPEC